MQGSLSFEGCTVHLALSPSFCAEVGVLDPIGQGAVKTPIPDQTALVGPGAVLQAALIDGGALTGMTNAIELVIGSCP